MKKGDSRTLRLPGYEKKDEKGGIHPNSQIPSLDNVRDDNVTF